MSKIDESYHQLLNNILEIGYKYPDPNRKGVERLEIPSYTFRHDFKDGFPAISTKKLSYKNVVTELIWFLRGDTNIKYLVDNDCNIWNKDAYNYYLKISDFEGNQFSLMSYKNFVETIKNCDISDLQSWWITEGYRLDYDLGDLGSIYGRQWKNFNGVDQIQRLITNLKEKPLGTDHIVNAWNVGDLENMALPPCHYGFQIVVKPLPIHKRKELGSKILGGIPYLNTSKEYLDFLDENNISKYGFELHWTQRSSDSFLGIPYNIASYATLALILEKITGYKALGIQGDLKKVHLYDNSIDAVREQLSRDVSKYDKCELKFSKGLEHDFKMFKHPEKEQCELNDIIDNLKLSDFYLENYESYPPIKVEMLERDE